MSNVEIKHMVRHNRLPENDIKLLFFILYLPIGLVLFILRTILILGLFLLGQILTDNPASQKTVNKIACVALGISVTVENPKAKENVDVYISNSLSVFDQVAVLNATGSISPGTSTFLEKIIGLSTYYFGNVANFEVFKTNVQQFLAEKKVPLYFAPEEKATNGKALLKFKTYPFQFTAKLQPVCVRIERPILDISVETLGSSYLNDVFFFMFSPITNYKLKFLPPLEKKSLSDLEFAEIVRQNIASELKIELSEHTSNDLLEWEKRKLAEERQRLQARNTRSSTLNTELQRMTLQVRDVLPHVPFTAIYNDLYVTRNVDNTITNILEGRVHFVAEQSSTQGAASQPSTSSSASNSSSSLASKVMVNTAASSFPKSASERSKSFQERKEQLIASARKRYIEKHNLDIPL